ncbi:MAG TPA: DNA polymerase III subunit gamma/tau C-terminal domain-containing protein, partial [Burkholderiaceae bacterium]|nr:DNA polymerase III subunit gamma/tau C-terminal domain-containing protein [Burkholderiaceae bacterium]
VDAPFEDETTQPLRVESPAAPPLAPPLAPQPVPTFSTDGLGARWAELVGRMAAAGSVQAMVRELAVQSQCIAFDEREQPLRCVLRVEREMLRNGTHVDKLQAALTETLGRAVRLEVEAGAVDDSPARREAAERARRQAEAEQIVYNDPLVQALMKEFKTARIVPGSVRPH